MQRLSLEHEKIFGGGFLGVWFVVFLLTSKWFEALDANQSLRCPSVNQTLLATLAAVQL